MKPVIRIYCIISLLLTGATLFSQENESEQKKSRNLRFHSGTILSAELLPQHLGITVNVINVSPFEPASKDISDLANAAIVVKLDPGRSISVYDYSLLNNRKTEFKCIGVREGEETFDANKWELENTSPDKRYTLLFKVELPLSSEKCEYLLRFNLDKNKAETVILPFVLINRPFTPPSKITDAGIVGVDLVKEEPLKTEDGKKQ